jgi:hypothetical protein
VDQATGCSTCVGHNRDFGLKFAELARSVYKNNDHRAAIKRRINERLRSEIVEEKSYAGCEAAEALTV